MRFTVRQGIGRQALLGALAALALLAPAADAEPPKTFYGVTPQVELGPYELERMGQGRVGTLRTSFSWGAIDKTPVPGDSNWAGYDMLVGGAAQAGIQILPVFDSVPAWVAELDGCKKDCHRHGPRSEVTLRAWRGFIRSVVERYGPEGTYWAAHPEVTPRPIRAWQIWNEQNSPQYFAPKPNVNVYARMLTAASRAINEVDPRGEVILGGMFATPGARRKHASWKYLQALYDRPGLRKRFDGVGIHPYAGSMRQVRQQVQLLRDVMKRNADSKTGMWVTEIGWSSYKDPKAYYLFVGKKRQAALLRKSFGYFTRKRAHLHIKTVNWFSWRDTPEDFKLCIWCPTSGLFTRDEFTPKPAWRAFTRFTGGT